MQQVLQLGPLRWPEFGKTLNVAKALKLILQMQSMYELHEIEVLN